MAGLEEGKINAYGSNGHAAEAALLKQPVPLISFGRHQWQPRLMSAIGGEFLCAPLP